MKMERPPEHDRAKRRLAPDPASRAWFMIFILSVCVGLMIYIDFNRRLWNAPAEALIAGRHWGSPDAELKITQFLDFQSSEVIRGEQMLYRFMQKHPTEVLLQTRYFPQDDKSVLIAKYAECANLQNKFRPYLSILYDRYYQWAGLPGLTTILKTIGTDAGLNMTQLNACVLNPDTTEIITDDRVYGESLFVRTTPSYFLNGKMAVGVEALEKALQVWDVTLTQDE